MPMSAGFWAITRSTAPARRSAMACSGASKLAILTVPDRLAFLTAWAAPSALNTLAPKMPDRSGRRDHQRVDPARDQRVDDRRLLHRIELGRTVHAELSANPVGLGLRAFLHR